MTQQCKRTCKGLCQAMEAAEKREREAMTAYVEAAASCDYPEVREVLQRLTRDRENGLALLRQTKEQLRSTFAVIDTINDSFA